MTDAPVRAGTARLVAAGLWLTLMAAIGPAPGQAQSRPAALPITDPSVPLAVPYLAQSVLLCGGAALAMVERWWGRRGVYAEEFAALVQPELGGIRTAALDSAAHARGWKSQAIQGTPAQAQQFLRAGVPVLALIEVRPDRYHYVVVLGWHDGEVVFHDPAGAPSMSLGEQAFLDRWAGADHWALIVQPGPPVSPAQAADPGAALVVDSMPCRPWLDRALDAADGGDFDAAFLLLEAAARACPAEPLVRREQAGVRFKQARYLEASRLAAGFLQMAPHDSLGAQLLAASRYLAGQPDAALIAWNRIGQPTVDLVVIDGSRRVRFSQLAGAIAVPHGSVLTPARLALARRRLGEVPAVRFASIGYQPVEGGPVELRATVAERPLVDPVWRVAASWLIGALGPEAVDLEVASPTGAGELWAAQWRWEKARPRVALRLTVPVRLGLPGVVEVEGKRESVRLSLDAAGTALREDTWRSARIGFGSWVTPGLRPDVGLGLERWSDHRNYLTLAGGIEFRAQGDRLRVTASGLQATALASHPGYRRGGVRGMWASGLDLARPTWSARAGGDWASAAAPVGAWPVAGGNLSRAIPLRAEPAPRHDLLPGRASARDILHGGVTADLPLGRLGPVLVAVGGFLDGAQVGIAADRSQHNRTYLDAGGGVRLALADGALGVVRLDLARRVVGNGNTAVSVGFHRGWPVFLQSSR